MAVSRRLGDEIYPSPPNGDLRPLLVSRDLIVERPLRQQKRPLNSRHLTGTSGQTETFESMRHRSPNCRSCPKGCIQLSNLISEQGGAHKVTPFERMTTGVDLFAACQMKDHGVDNNVSMEFLTSP